MEVICGHWLALCSWVQYSVNYWVQVPQEVRCFLGCSPDVVLWFSWHDVKQMRILPNRDMVLLMLNKYHAVLEVGRFSVYERCSPQSLVRFFVKCRICTCCGYFKRSCLNKAFMKPWDQALTSESFSLTCDGTSMYMLVWVHRLFTRVEALFTDCSFDSKKKKGGGILFLLFWWGFFCHSIKRCEGD